MSSNNFEIQFLSNNNELLVPIPDDVIELNRYMVESNAVDTNNNAMSQIPYYGGPVSYVESNNPMPILGPNSLSSPITVVIPDDLAPDGPFILLNSSFQDGSRCSGTEPPENIITPKFLLNTQNVIPLSAEYGLPTIPMLQDPNNRLNSTGILENTYAMNKLDNTNFTPDMTTERQLASLPKEQTYVNSNYSNSNMNYDQENNAMDYNNQNINEKRNIIVSKSDNVNVHSPQVKHSPSINKNAMYLNKNLFRKILMLISILLLISVIYLVISKR
jgi:hypothetical protein